MYVASAIFNSFLRHMSTTEKKHVIEKLQW